MLIFFTFMFKRYDNQQPQVRWQSYIDHAGRRQGPSFLRSERYIAVQACRGYRGKLFMTSKLHPDIDHPIVLLVMARGTVLKGIDKVILEKRDSEGHRIVLVSAIVNGEVFVTLDGILDEDMTEGFIGV